MLGEVFGNYRITGALASGGMGAVYRGEHALIGKPAAIKVLLPEWSANREIVNRFFNEARATTAIRHPGIVEIFDYGQHESGRAYLVMELLDGEPLAARLARTRIPEPIAIGLVRSIIGALAAAHRVGIIHRDLKPDNVFLVRDPDVPGGERPKLLDFGIAKLAETTPDARATRTGVVLGTPTYMAPEQCRGAGSIDARADLYAIGCILYEMLSGRPPFVAEGAGELMAAHLMTVPDRVRVHAPEVSPVVDEIVARLLAKNPGERYASADELLVALGGTPQDASGRPLALVTPAMLTPVPVPTTLSGAASASGSRTAAATRRSRKGWIAAIGAIVVAGAVGVAVIATQSGAGASGSATTHAAAAPAMPIAAPTKPAPVAPAPAPIAQPTPTPAPVAPPPPAPLPAQVAQPAPEPTPVEPTPVEPPQPVKPAHHHDRDHVAKAIKPARPAAATTTPVPATQPPKPTLPSELPPEL